MFWIYLASAIFGGSFLIPMILGGLASDMEIDVDADVDTDFEFDADVDADFDIDADTADSSSLVASGIDTGQAIVGSLLSFRSVVFFAAFFGAAGLVFTALDYNLLITLATALVLGLVAAVSNSVLFGLLKSSETTSRVGERSFEGRPASVTVPIEGERRGRIRLDLAGQPHYLVAQAYNGTDAFRPGASVVVVETRGGVALVASLIELE